jgi:hypothetical protein
VLRNPKLKCKLSKLKVSLEIVLYSSIQQKVLCLPKAKLMTPMAKAELDLLKTNLRMRLTQASTGLIRLTTRTESRL